jgi:RimJ/RimL family protein N-acetyltransferase
VAGGATAPASRRPHGRRIARAGVSVVLEPLAREHLPGVENLLRDPEVLYFTRVPEPPSADFAETWLNRYESGREDGTREGFAIVDGRGEFLGLALAPRLDREARTAELGYIVAPAARGRGVATEALRLLTKWAFEERGMLRLELLIGVENGASKRVAERSGYRREGVLRSVHLKQDRREDTEIWSRLAADPEL